MTKRERILEAASLLFSEQNYGTVTVEDIAARAGVAKGTVYNHFTSKQALFSEVITSRLEHLVEILTESSRQRDDVQLNLRRIAVHIMSFMLKYRQFFCMWKREEPRICQDTDHPWYALRAQLHAVLAAELERGIAEGVVRNECTEYLSAVILACTDGAVYRNLDGAERDIHAERDRLAEFVWRAVREEHVPCA